MSFSSSHFLTAFELPLAIALGGSAIVLLLVAGYRLRETTLVAPVAWGVLAIGLLTFSCIEAATLPKQGSIAELNNALSGWSYLRYSAAALIIAPILAQLGAKSPQNGAWQFIVVTLVVVLLLPVIQGWAYGDEAPIVHGLVRWLLAAHVFLGVGNYLFTRFAASAFLLGIGATSLIAEYLPLASRPASASRELFGLSCLTAAVVAGFAAVAARRKGLLGTARLWNDFRDAFGAVWTIRIAERLNASARLNRWPVEFSWGGITPTDSLRASNEDHELSRLEPELQHRIERELRSYLRRFVSHDWIARRLPRGPKGNSRQATLTGEARR